jgi:glyceraldehyde 3-phosphate dehydrogenase
VINVSLVDLTLQVARDTSTQEVNALLERASEGSAILGFNRQPLVSVDFNHDPRSAIFDASHTRVNGRLVKVMAWYDNEWGFSNRMLDTARAMAAARG